MNVNESNRKLPKIFPGKNLQTTQKSFMGWFDQKKIWRGVLKIDTCPAAKHKLILSWPNIETSPLICFVVPKRLYEGLKGFIQLYEAPQSKSMDWFLYNRGLCHERVS